MSAVIRTGTAGVATALAVLACAPRNPSSTPAATVRELVSPAGPGSGEPSLTSAADGAVVMSWIESTDGLHRLRFATRAAGADTWSPARTIAEGRDWFVNWADFPTIVAFRGGGLAAHWLAKTSSGRYDYDVLFSRSSDGGATWSTPARPYQDQTKTEHGFVSLVPWPDGRLEAIWLDGRGMGEGGRGAMSLYRTTIGADGTALPEQPLDTRVCDCCQTSAAATSKGIAVVYRDRSEAEVRDISSVRLEDGRWTEPQPLSGDGWNINGCPVNGPAIAADGDAVAVAWFTNANDTPRVKLAFSSDAGASYAKPIVVDDGNPIGRVDTTLLPNGDAVVSWLEKKGTGAEVRARVVARSGRAQPSFMVAPSTSARSSGFPRMERALRELVFAWTDPADPPRVRTALVSGSF